MSETLFEKETAYRTLDCLYRLNRGLFEIEYVVARSAKLNARLTVVASTSRMSALLAGVLVIVPIFVSLGNITFSSGPAWVVYGIAAFVIVVWHLQAREAGNAEKELLNLELYAACEALEQRNDFMLEGVNSYVNRCRLVSAILAEIAAAIPGETDARRVAELKEKQTRYESVHGFCENEVEGFLRRAEDLKKRRIWTEEQLEELRGWAAALPKFSRKAE